MRTRIITGMIAAALFLSLLFFAPSVCFKIAVMAACVLAMYEVLVAVGFKKYPFLMVCGCAFGALAPWYTILATLGARVAIAGVGALALVVVIAAIALYEKLPVERLGLLFFLSLIIPLGFAALAYLRDNDDNIHGIFYVLVAVALPWMSDIGAYFAGTFFGKHKLCPKISPKKTVEGLIGGFVASIVFNVLVAWGYQQWYLIPYDKGQVSFLSVILIAIVVVPLSVIGDLFASVIKRQFGIKDYGNILPGHGGILDRCDSLIFAVPVFYLFDLFLPIIR